MRALTGDAVSTFELIPRIALDLVLRHIESAHDPLDAMHPWYVLLEIGLGRMDSGGRQALEAELAAAMEAGEALDAAIAANEAQREAFWRLRELIPEAQRREGASIKHDVSVATSKLPQFIVEASALAAEIAPSGRIIAYGHLGDGNVHFNINASAGEDRAAFLQLAPQLHRAVHDLAARFGGSFSAEHGVGRLKR